MSQPEEAISQTRTNTAGKDRTAIEIEELTKTFDDVVALDEVSLEIEEGEFFTLLGPSGSGKSTLLNLIGGFLSRSSGHLAINGEDMAAVPPQNRPVSTVFQEYALFPHMTVEENVGYGLDIRGTPAEQKEQLIDRYLSLLKIQDLRKRDPAQLSGGQRQRVALARSLVVEPDILLLDEPLGPLDEKLRREMQVELRQLQQTLNTTFVYVTHDQEEALTMSDRVCLLNYGEIVEVGTPERIYGTPRNKFTAGFIGSGNLIDGNLAGRDGDHFEIEVGNQTFVGRSALEDVSADDPVSVSVRPRHLQITTDTDAALENQVRGVVDAEVYKGEGYNYVIELDDGPEIEATSDRRLGVSNGDDVVVSWARDNCVIVAR